MKKWLNPGSFDLFTFGHLDMVERWSKQADKLYVWVGINEKKTTMFSQREREDMVRANTSHLANVEVVSYKWLTVKYAYEHRIKTIIRWTRSAKDYEEEALLAKVNESQYPDIETMLLITKNDNAHISSSTAKAIHEAKWDVHKYISLYSKQALEARMSSQYIMWFVGPSWVWKTKYTKYLAAEARSQWINTTIINLDNIWHEILWWDLSLPVYKETREKIKAAFWDHCMNEDGSINKKVLWPMIFWDEKNKKTLDEIMLVPMMTRYRDKIANLTWLILIDWALIAEFGLWYLCNNNFALISADKQTLKERLSIRDDLDEDQARRRYESQLSAESKAILINKEIEETRHWKLIQIDNSEEIDDWSVKNVLEDIIKTVDMYWELRITRILNELWIKNVKELYDEIRLNYAKNENYYHRFNHIIAWLDLLIEYKDIIPNFKEVAFSWLYHDIIYFSEKPNNELISWVQAYNKSKQLWLWEAFSENVLGLVVSTKHTEAPKSEAEKFLHDIDFSILWQSWEVFKRYEDDVRKEYSHVSDRAWKEWRKQFLEWVLQKEDIFYTQTFKDRFESQAKSNIQRSIDELGKK